MTKWYDKQGNVLVDSSKDNWLEDMAKVEELLTDSKYALVRQDYTKNGKYWVSTVWLGLDHNYFPSGKPMIFETMVFEMKDGKKDFGGVYQARYSTEQEAIAGHEKVLKEWENV